MPKVNFINTDRNTCIAVNSENSHWIETNEFGKSIILKLMTKTDSEFNEYERKFIKNLTSSNFFEEPSQPTESRLSILGIEITSKCNLKCTHCYNEKFAKSDYLNLEDIKTIVNEAYEIGCRHFSFIGGELLCNEEWHDILSYAKQKAAKINIVTNGTLITKKSASQLAELCDTISVSVDGHTSDIHDYIRGKGSFDKTLSGLKFLLKYKNNKNRIKINHTITNHNLVHLKNFFDFAENLDIDYVNVIFVQANGAGKDIGKEFSDDQNWLNAFNELLKISKTSNVMSSVIYDIIHSLITPTKNSCGVGKSFLRIGSDGLIYPCAFLKENLNFGKYTTNSLRKHLSSDHSLKNIDVSTIENCKECMFKFCCGGGCRAESLIHSGNFHSKPQVCYFNVYKEILSNIGKYESLFAKCDVDENVYM